jgi:multidrug efflux pump subunit AcrA (membrane-fusion protein)
MSGQVVLQTLNRHGEINQIRVGDELAPGQPFIKIIDPTGMLLDATMSQTESELLHIGQAARVRFDAFPEIQLNGRVRSIGALAVSGRRVNYYVRRVPVRVEIQEHDSRVLPDLTASADVVVGENETGVIVPREAIVEHEGKSMVFVKEADAFEPRAVEVGGFNSTHAAVVAGLSGGEELSLETHGN